MDQGKILLEGDFEELKNSELYQKFEELKNWVEGELKKQNKELEQKLRKQTSLKIPLETKTSETLTLEAQPRTTKEEVLVAELALAEVRQFGTVSLETFKNFFKAYGGISSLGLALLLNFLQTGFLMLAMSFFQNWSFNFNPATKYKDLAVYAFLLFLGSCFESVSKIVLVIAGYKASLHTHNRMTYRILHAKIEDFLNKVPSGRIMNRFSKDLSTIGLKLQQDMGILMYFFSKVCVIFITLTLVLGWEVLLLVLVLILICVWLQGKYQPARREYSRLESISRSPILNSSSDTI